MPDEVMNIEIVVTDSSGNRFVGTAQLTHAGSRSTRRTASARPIRSASNPSKQIDFTLQPRAFIKRYVRGMSGAQKFVLLLAKMSEGSTTKPIDFKLISKQWSRMTGLMGDFN